MANRLWASTAGRKIAYRRWHITDDLQSDPRTKHAAPPVRAGRSGFSLLEVVLALAIFLASVAAIGQLLRIGMRSAQWGAMTSDATLRCESIMAELVAGIAPLENRTASFFPNGEGLEREDRAPELDEEQWEYEVEVAPTEIPALVRVKVTVRHLVGEEPDLEIALARLVADPDAFAPLDDTFEPLVALPPAPLTVAEMLTGSGAAQ